MKPYKHVYGGNAVDMMASRDDVMKRFGHDPHQFWSPRCKVLDFGFGHGGDEIVVTSTDDRDAFVVTHIMR
jgi:hypothetical protein